MTPNEQNRSGLWVVVPVKPFNEGKSRLAAQITPQQRCALNRELLSRTLTAINQAQLDAEILVVSRDSRALAAAERAGSHALAEESQPCTALPSSCTPNDAESEPQLNAALTQAARHAAAHGATKLLVLPTDMPNLTAEDVRAMAASRGLEPQINIAPSRDGGTNALMLQPAQVIPFAFGRDSFLRHQRLAAQAGIPVHVFQSDSLFFDIDQPEDYRRVFSHGS
ncbi:MAG: 2-phospho-L-lactate guanylyltransferase [Caldilineaceae bacterium SB0670_bin_27]|uniref:Phosphoenolpyruvate guanylyltransferase n=1 Tax=Caldilineaceae bacterium SB0664_bin_27 TaxID=2605260 RepID=A0A6B0YNV4_9CHLR|nr:2-phospho-L-lactate guanylyltransferase [Caldilineaceae bacterium SB0664_bin_27]MYJ78311.1 2-phospho-L-lactate guanylyltransferase [Caldilineaceae bacterium SB0670_bin_27]